MQGRRHRSLPALNARPEEQLDEWLAEITAALAHTTGPPGPAAAPFAVNQIVHKSNDRLDHDIEVMKHKVPIIVSALGARRDVKTRSTATAASSCTTSSASRLAHKAIERVRTG